MYAGAPTCAGTEKAVQILKRLFETAVKQNNFQRVVRECKITGGGVGHCVCELTVEEQHANPMRTLHGGLTASLIDIASTAALMTTERAQAGVSVDLNVTYMRPAKVGDTVIFDAKVLKVGKSLAFTEVDITNKKDGELVAVGRHTKALMP
uniref:Acyl-coenzyme A thioesterase 13 n=1 Tax=Romanomermis culicivorax TaxID=13658 RepID=A0A915I8D3_ROMCU